MPQSSATSRSANHLLSTLSAGDYALLEANLESVPLALRQTIEEPNKPIHQVYFVEDGLMSVVASAADKSRIEVGLIGWEGMSGIPVMMGDDRTPYHNFIQIAGRAQRISSDHLRKAIGRSPSLQIFFLRYVKAFMSQTYQTALAHGRAKINARLAHWLLMAHDRCQTDELHLTHEFLALMLGVQRPGVTIALKRLASLGLINPTRASIVVLDRKGLEKIAGGLYGVPEAEYQRFIGWRTKKR